MHDKRCAQLKQWVSQFLSINSYGWQALENDASFRRYYRIKSAQNTWIGVDSPPEKEDNQVFIHLARRFKQAGVHVPTIYQYDLQHGFMLISDLGTARYQDVLNTENADILYTQAIDALLFLQHSMIPHHVLPTYGPQTFQAENDFFHSWFLQRLLRLVPNKKQTLALHDWYAKLNNNALSQPRVCVHRDYHCRNLMHTQTDNPGIIDFQSACWGPITYDLASLFRDSYMQWPESRITSWLTDYHDKAQYSGLLSMSIDFRQFYTWFDWMAMQRNIKAIGIFSRLALRDKKTSHLADIPRTISYLLYTCEKYGLDTILHLLQNDIMHRLSSLELSR